MKSLMRRYILHFVFVMASILPSWSVYGSEGGGNQYFNGSSLIMAGYTPPSGDYLIAYSAAAQANRVNNGRGVKQPVKVRFIAAGEALRYLHMRSIELLGGRWGYYIAASVLWEHLQRGTRQQDKTGMGDILFDPVVVAWHIQNMYIATGLDMVLPAGAYKKGDLVNIGRNYYGFMPTIALTYLSDSGFEMSSKLLYSFNTVNPATHPRSRITVGGAGVVGSGGA